MLNHTQSQSKSSYKFWLLGAFLVLTFFLGGSSHKDVQSLSILRPISIFFCSIALMTLRAGDIRSSRALFWGFGGVITLVIFYLIPFPAETLLIFQPIEPFRDIYAEIGFASKWQSVSTDPTESWDTLFSLATPLAVLLMSVQLSERDRYRLLPLLISLCCVSGATGILQLLSSPTGPLYFYDITHSGSAVGLFANRNHSAALLACVFPMLAVFATGNGHYSEASSRRAIAIAIAVVVLPLIIVTGSRSGLITGILGFSGSVFLWPRNNEKGFINNGKSFFQSHQTLFFGALAFLALSGVTLLFSRGFALERLVTEIPGQDGRKDFAIISAGIFLDDFLWGAGPGALASVYKIYEPLNLLDATFLNRAHNDYIETLVTFGAMAIPLLLACALYFGWKSMSYWRTAESRSMPSIFGKMASLAIAIMAIASFSDYPLRTPTILSVLIIFALWFSGPAPIAKAANSTGS